MSLKSDETSPDKIYSNQITDTLLGRRENAPNKKVSRFLGISYITQRGFLSTPSPHVLHIGEDEGLIDVKPTGDDVLCVLVSKSVGLFHSKVLPEKLLVVSQLDDQGHVKYVL